MGKENHSEKLEHLLDRLEKMARDNERISWDVLLGVLGRASFGPLLLLAGLATLAPVIGDIPGMPTIIGLIVLLLAAQLLVGRQHVWLPHWLTKRSMANRKLSKAMKWIRPPARFLDRLVRPRLSFFVQGIAVRGIAFSCILVALMMPIMEVVPFSANLAGIVITAFGLALIACDGLMALIALLTMASGIVLLLYQIM